MNIKQLRQQRAEKQAAKRSLTEESKQLTRRIIEAQKAQRHDLIMYLAKLSHWDLTRSTRFFSIVSSEYVENFSQNGIAGGTLGRLLVEHRGDGDELAKLVKRMEDRKVQIIKAAKDQEVLAELAASGLFISTKAGESLQ